MMRMMTEGHSGPGRARRGEGDGDGENRHLPKMERENIWDVVKERKRASSLRFGILVFSCVNFA